MATVPPTLFGHPVVPCGSTTDHDWHGPNAGTYCAGHPHPFGGM